MTPRKKLVLQLNGDMDDADRRVAADICYLLGPAAPERYTLGPIAAHADCQVFDVSIRRGPDYGLFWNTYLHISTSTAAQSGLSDSQLVAAEASLQKRLSKLIYTAAGAEGMNVNKVDGNIWVFWPDIEDEV